MLLQFIDSLTSSDKLSVSFLANLVKDDNRTLTGKTLSRISADTSLPRSSLTAASVKKNMVYFPVPAAQMWRVDLLLEILNVEAGPLTVNNFEREELKAIVNHLCTT